jgi:glycosyltransferase involved in cell wall biosynthesis
MHPKLSVLIPVYNREKVIKQTIESVLKQSFSDYEIICVDNNSTDDTFKIIQEIAAHESRLKVYKNKINFGPVSNWKICLDYAQGAYIHFLWSDDWVEKNFYEDAFNLMEKDKTEIISSWTYRFHDDNKFLSWRNSNKKIPGIAASKKILMLTNELPVSPAAYIIPTKLVRRNFYDNIPSLWRYDPVKSGVGVDSLIIAGSCLNQKEISILQKPSINFRVHDNISTELSKDGSLKRMYLISHMWFINKKNVPLCIDNVLYLATKYALYFRPLLLNKKVIYFFVNFIKKLKIAAPVDVLNIRYFSRKAQFTNSNANE